MSTSDATSSSSLLRIVDIIPATDSGETDQNSEPSIAVNPVDPMQMFAGTFGTLGSGLNPNPFFVSTDGGTTWSNFGIIHDDDKSIAWKADGSPARSRLEFSLPSTQSRSRWNRACRPR